jgi:hypothetical protein
MLFPPPPIEPLKDAFWAIVVDCLHHFHGMDRCVAEDAAASLRHTIEVPPFVDRPPPGYDREVFYHNDPLYVADDIAGREADVRAVAAEYEAIQDRHYGPAERIAFAPASEALYPLAAG